MPGNDLYPGLTEAVPLEEVDVTITVGFEEASQTCNRLMAELGKPWMVVFNCLFNYCISFGCSVFHHNEGKVESCEVYVAWEFLLDHELRHCQGYKDVWY